MSSRPLSPDDLFCFRWIDHPRLSPDGSRLAWQVGWGDSDQAEARSGIWVAARDGSGAHQLSPETGRDRGPEWSPDGRHLAYLGKRGIADQAVVVPAEGGDPRQITELAEGVTAVRWSPDGSSLAFLGTVLAEPEAVVEDPRPPEHEGQARRPPVARVTRTFDYRFNGKGYFDGRRTHLFTVPVAGGEPHQLTRGPWSVEDMAWAPDGSRLAVVGADGPDADLIRTRTLYVADATSGELHPILSGMVLSAPAWSPRGDLIAFLAPTVPATGFLDRIWVVPAGGGAPRCLTISLDRAAGHSPVSDMRIGETGRIIWDANGVRIYFVLEGSGSSEVCSVDLDGATRQELPGERRAVVGFDVAGGVVAACVTDPTSPGDLVVADEAGERRVTDANPWLHERWLGEPERLEFTAADGWPIEGWLLKPPDFDPTRKYPLVLQIHGGPHGQYGWVLFHEFQVLAGLGCLVLYCNPRGSEGYGEAFCRACVRDWGGADYQDLMTTLDQLIERTGFVDTARLGVAGGSYGGFMTNWIIGHTDRFAAAVSMRSISNLVSDYAQNDIVPWSEQEMGPPPWPDPDVLWRRSPIRYVRDIRTPLLLLHSEMDLRCPVSQAEELFGALRLLRREVELVRFPGESHDLSRNGRPDRRAERLRRIAGWFERHLLKE